MAKASPAGMVSRSPSRSHDHGATLHVAAGQAAEAYSGSFAFTVAYE